MEGELRYHALLELTLDQHLSPYSHHGLIFLDGGFEIRKGCFV
jgi:hypothetical protein